MNHLAVTNQRLRRRWDDELASSEPTLDLMHVGVMPADAYYFIHFCSGPRRPGDVIDLVERTAAEHGLNIVGIAIDPLAEVGQVQANSLTRADLLSPRWLDWLVQLIHSGKVLGGMGSPPCSTISAARHVPIRASAKSRHRAYHGPRPLRCRSDPWVPLSFLSPKEVHAVNVGSALFLLVVGLLGEICNFGGWSSLEHPADRGKEPYASFFPTREVQKLCRTFNLKYEVIHQCMFGALSKKPTGLLLPSMCPSFGRLCNHSHKHPWLLGLDSSGHFRTTPAAKYPVGLCQALADSFVQRLVLVRHRNYVRPFLPKVRSDTFSLPYESRMRASWAWPQPSPGFLTKILAAIHDYQIHRGTHPPQQ